MNQITINTSQNVHLELKVASVGERMAAFFMDILIKTAYLACVYWLFFEFFRLDAYFKDLDYWSVGAILITLTLPIHLYTLVLESLMEGQTLGKRMMKIKVIKIDGYQASFGDYLMRWVFRLIDILSNSGIVGILSMIISKHNQRLGDLATGTAVISLKNNIDISHTILVQLSEDYVPQFPQVIRLNDNDMRIIKDHFINAQKNDDKVVLSKLSQKIKATLKLAPDAVQLTDRQFISTIIKDYNFYTGKE